jgi:hypothetical protein
MLTEYIKAAMHQAKYEILSDDAVSTGKFRAFKESTLMRRLLRHAAMS